MKKPEIVYYYRGLIECVGGWIPGYSVNGGKIMNEERSTGPETNADPAPVDLVVMPQVPGWYLVEVTGLIRQPDSGFQVDYCREKTDSDGGGMEWVGNYRHNVVAWHELPKRVKSA